LKKGSLPAGDEIVTSAVMNTVLPERGDSVTPSLTVGARSEAKSPDIAEGIADALGMGWRSAMRLARPLLGYAPLSAWLARRRKG
jgi:hypothetical protein